MRLSLAAALLAASFASIDAATAQTSSAGDETQCWDVLHNVARDKKLGAGHARATGDYDRMHSSSNEDKKVQGPGAEPKDPTGVTVGESVAGQKRSESGASIRPPGLPNC